VLRHPVIGGELLRAPFAAITAYAIVLFAAERPSGLLSSAK
jgi:hypothetical protein